MPDLFVSVLELLEVVALLPQRPQAVDMAALLELFEDPAREFFRAADTEGSDHMSDPHGLQRSPLERYDAASSSRRPAVSSSREALLAARPRATARKREAETPRPRRGTKRLAAIISRKRGQRTGSLTAYTPPGSLPLPARRSAAAMSST